MLQAGHPAPNFSLPDQHGQIVSLESFRGKKFWCGFTRKRPRLVAQQKAAAYVTITKS